MSSREGLDEEERIMEYYSDVLEQVLHELKLCKFMDDVHDADPGQKLSDRIRDKLLEHGHLILDKNDWDDTY